MQQNWECWLQFFCGDKWKESVGCMSLFQTGMLIHCPFLVCLYLQDLCRQYKLWDQRRHDQTGLPSLRPDQKCQSVLGSDHKQAQGLRLHRVRGAGSCPAGPRTDEWRHDWRQKHQGGSYLYILLRLDFSYQDLSVWFIFCMILILCGLSSFFLGHQNGKYGAERVKFLRLFENWGEESIFLSVQFLNFFKTWNMNEIMCM